MTLTEIMSKNSKPSTIKILFNRHFTKQKLKTLQMPNSNSLELFLRY